MNLESNFLNTVYYLRVLVPVAKANIRQTAKLGFGGYTFSMY